MAPGDLGSYTGTRQHWAWILLCSPCLAVNTLQGLAHAPLNPSPFLSSLEPTPTAFASTHQTAPVKAASRLPGTFSSPPNPVLKLLTSPDTSNPSVLEALCSLGSHLGRNTFLTGLLSHGLCLCRLLLVPSPHQGFSISALPTFGARSFCVMGAILCFPGC